MPFFRKVETDTDFHDDFHGTDGPIILRRFKREEWLPAQVAFYNACKDAGFPDSPDHNDPDSSGVGPTPFNNPNGIRWSTALGYLDPAPPPPQSYAAAQLHRAPHSVPGKPRHRGWRWRAARKGVIVEADQIILSAGAIGSPQILMLSGIGPKEHLQSLGIPLMADLPGVGQNLRDHPAVWVTWKTKEGFPLDGLAPRMQVTLRYTADGSQLRNDMKISMQSFATGRP